MSKKARVGNDITWLSISTEEKLKREDLQKLSNLPFWKGLKLGDGFKAILKAALLYLEFGRQT